MQLKKSVIRPNSQRVSNQLLLSLVSIREEFLGDLDQETVLRQFQTHKHLLKVIQLVLTSINFILKQMNHSTTENTYSAIPETFSPERTKVQ
jgi:hypothetical protein